MAASHLILGCGYLGERVAQSWLKQGYQVAALTRSRGDALRMRGIEPIQGDVLDVASLSVLPAVDTVLYAIGMDRSSGRSFHDVYVGGLRNVLQHLPAPRRFIYVSSTSVYGQTDGEQVDENSPTEPRESNGVTVLEAEQALRAAIPGSIILRFAGIYGPGRVIRRSTVEKGEPLPTDPEKWLNLIHVDDGVRAVDAAFERGGPGETYLVADDQPVRRRDFYRFMAEVLGAPAPHFVPAPPGAIEPNRRVNNRKMRQELAVELAYPDYQRGLRAAISSDRS